MNEIKNTPFLHYFKEIIKNLILFLKEFIFNLDIKNIEKNNKIFFEINSKKFSILIPKNTLFNFLNLFFFIISFKMIYNL